MPVAIRSSSTCPARTVCPSEKWARPWERTRTSWKKSALGHGSRQETVCGQDDSNVTHIEDPTRASLRAGCDGIAAIYTQFRSVLGVRLGHLRPEPTVEGYTTPGVIRAKRDADRIADVHGDCQSYQNEFPGKTLSGIGVSKQVNDAPIYSARVRHGAGVHGVMKFRLPDHPRDEEQLLRVHGEAQVRDAVDFKGHSVHTLQRTPIWSLARHRPGREKSRARAQERDSVRCRVGRRRLREADRSPGAR